MCTLVFDEILFRSQLFAYIPCVSLQKIMVFLVVGATKRGGGTHTNMCVSTLTWSVIMETTAQYFGEAAKKSSSLNGRAIKVLPPHPLELYACRNVGTLERWK